MKTKTRELVFTGVMAAMIAVLAQLAIPMPWGVPLTLQTFAIALCGYFLGWKLGLSAVCVYLLAGAVGIPVFANFKGGFQVLVGPTGGFLIGFLVMELLCGLPKKAFPALLCGMAGLLFCHILGVCWFAYTSGRTLGESFLLVSLPYLVKDFISVIAAYFSALAIRKRLPAPIR